MAITVMNKGLFLLGKDDASLLDLRVAVFTGVVPAQATMRDCNTVADVVASALVESGLASYARTDVTGVTYTEQDGTDTGEWRGDAMVLTTIEAGETWTCVVWYKENTGDTGELIAVDEPTTPLVTNGGNVTLPAFVVDTVQQ